MDNDALPTNTLHYREALEELRGKKFIQAQDFFQLPSHIVEYSDSIFGLQNTSSLMLYACTMALEPYRTRVHLGNRVGILFLGASNNTLRADGRTAQFREFCVLMSFNMPTVDIIRPMGAKAKNLAVILEADALIDEYGLKYELAPPYVQTALRSGSSMPARIMFSLSPRCRMILNDIFVRHFDGVMQYRYLRAKTEELLCELVHHINEIGSRKLVSSHLPRLERQRQSIEVAAQIYRQQIGLMPSVDRIARLVGLNRNVMTNGFKAAFGVSPGEYARMTRLNWAREQLEHGLYTVGEVATLAGYNSVGSFTRAYTEFFGCNPSQDARALAAGDLDPGGLRLAQVAARET